MIEATVIILTVMVVVLCYGYLKISDYASRLINLNNKLLQEIKNLNSKLYG